MWNILLAAAMLFFLSTPAGGAPDSGSAGESHPKESAPSDVKKKPDEKKQDAEQKSADTASKPAPDENAPKAEEPPATAPKPDESSGKKSVTSLNLTIKLALMANPSLFPFELEVEMDGQKAVLTGAVPDEEDKAKATEDVRKIEGVESVVNKLTVEPSLKTTLTKRQDEAIAQYVKERLSRSETLKAVGFDVKSDNGVVSLSGKTRFQVIVLEAAEAARHIPGVHAVHTAAVQITGKD